MSPSTRCTCVRELPKLTLLVRDPECPANPIHELIANLRPVHEAH